MSYSGIFDGAKKLMDAYENLNKPINNIKHNSTTVSFEENERILEECDKIYDYFSDFVDDYEKTVCHDLGIELTKTNLQWVLSNVNVFKEKYIKTNGVYFSSQTLQLSKEELDFYLNCQNNIIDMLKEKITLLIENINQNNYYEFNKLGMFLLDKLSICIENVEGHKRNMALLENFPYHNYYLRKKYDQDYSKYVGMFFDRKYDDLVRNYPLVRK